MKRKIIQSSGSVSDYVKVRLQKGQPLKHLQYIVDDNGSFSSEELYFRFEEAPAPQAELHYAAGEAHWEENDEGN